MAALLDREWIVDGDVLGEEELLEQGAEVAGSGSDRKRMDSEWVSPRGDRLAFFGQIILTSCAGRRGRQRSQEGDSFSPCALADEDVSVPRRAIHPHLVRWPTRTSAFPGGRDQRSDGS